MVEVGFDLNVIDDHAPDQLVPGGGAFHIVDSAFNLASCHLVPNPRYPSTLFIATARVLDMWTIPRSISTFNDASQP